MYATCLLLCSRVEITSCHRENRPLPQAPTPSRPLDPYNHDSSSRPPAPGSLSSLNLSLGAGDSVIPPGYEYHKNDQLLPNPRYDLSSEDTSPTAPGYPDSTPSPPHSHNDIYPEPPSTPHSLEHSQSLDDYSDVLSYIDPPVVTRLPVQTFGPIPEVHTISSTSLSYLPTSNASSGSGPDDPLEDIRALGRDGETWERRNIIHEQQRWEDTGSEDSETFVNYSFLSHLAVGLRDTVPRGTHVKGSIPYPRAFTGKDIVVRLQYFSLLPFSHLSVL